MLKRGGIIEEVTDMALCETGIELNQALIKEIEGLQRVPMEYVVYVTGAVERKALSAGSGREVELANNRIRTASATLKKHVQSGEGCCVIE